MKITGTRSASLPDGRFVTAIDTDSGLTGIGFGSVAAMPRVARIVSELLVGEDPCGVAGLWQRMTEGVARGHGSDAREAVAALDLALWDLKAKSGDEPLWRTLGGLRPEVRVYAGACDPRADDAAVLRWYSDYVRNHGCGGAMLHAGVDADEDLRRLELVRSALASRTADPALMLDLGERFRPKDASRRVRAIELRHDLTLVRDPAQRHDAAGLKRVSSAIRAAVCAGGRLSSPADYLAHFHARSLDVVELAVAGVGITGALQLADTAFGFELPVLLTDSPGNLHAHIGAVIPTCMGMEVHAPLGGGALSGDVRIEGGWAIAGDRPGHGVIVDPAILAPPASKGRRKAGGGS